MYVEWFHQSVKKEENNYKNLPKNTPQFQSKLRVISKIE